ncbi:hypothetical protein PspLS_12022 [Pyricularia sp. CBS 133598]|nr:hypothetical protein PspLS_12022 [Pyricularia sp. CBS 133598]
MLLVLGAIVIELVQPWHDDLPFSQPQVLGNVPFFQLGLQLRYGDIEIVFSLQYLGNCGATTIFAPEWDVLMNELFNPGFDIVPLSV